MKTEKESQRWNPKVPLQRCVFPSTLSWYQQQARICLFFLSFPRLLLYLSKHYWPQRLPESFCIISFLCAQKQFENIYTMELHLFKTIAYEQTYCFSSFLLLLLFYFIYFIISHQPLLFFFLLNFTEFYLVT